MPLWGAQTADFFNRERSNQQIVASWNNRLSPAVILAIFRYARKHNLHGMLFDSVSDQLIRPAAAYFLS